MLTEEVEGARGARERKSDGDRKNSKGKEIGEEVGVESNDPIEDPNICDENRSLGDECLADGSPSTSNT